jgi:hypothetical protein
MIYPSVLNNHIRSGHLAIYQTKGPYSIVHNLKTVNNIAFKSDFNVDIIYETFSHIMHKSVNNIKHIL